MILLISPYYDIMTADPQNSKVVSISKIKTWDKNPRGILEKDFERLKRQIKELGQYKPLICERQNGKYVVLGGNMRLKAYRELGVKNLWISIVKPKNDTERIKISLSDNDRVGFYEDDRLAALIKPFKKELDLKDFKVDITLPSIDLERILKRFSEGEGYIDIDTSCWTIEDYHKSLLIKLKDKSFPYRCKSDIDLVGDFWNLCRTHNKDSLAGYAIGMELHPWLWSTKAGKSKKTAVENWSHEIQEYALKRFYAEEDQGPLTLYHIRRITSIIKGGQIPYQFHPALAKYYYNKYTSNDAIIIDPSAGWGGRMLGWLSLGWKGKFIGIDPSPDSNRGNQNILNFLNLDKKNVQLIQLPFEDWKAKKLYGKVDMVFTSPPYFDIEEYAGENQSHKRYPELDKWLNVFLKNYILKCARLLKPKRYCILNIGKVGKNRIDISKEVKRFIKESKLKLIEIKEEGSLAGSFGVTRGRTEPFYVCQKVRKNG